jgi:hypothetical protein
VRIGTDPQATDGYDDHLDQYLPPKSPGGFDGRLTNGDMGYLTDIRSDDLSAKVFVLEYQSETQTGIGISWENTPLGKYGKFTIIDDINGGSFALRMTTTDNLQIDSSDHLGGKLKIVYRPLGLPPYMGDIDKNERVDLIDAIKIIQMLSGINPPNVSYDTEGMIGGKVGLDDAIYVLQVIAEIRAP